MRYIDDDFDGLIRCRWFQFGRNPAVFQEEALGGSSELDINEQFNVTKVQVRGWEVELFEGDMIAPS